MRLIIMTVRLPIEKSYYASQWGNDNMVQRIVTL